MFSIRLKESLEPIVLWKRPRQVFALFLKAFAWETNLWDFAIKAKQNWEEKFAINKNTFGRNENETKEFSDSNFD